MLSIIEADDLDHRQDGNVLTITDTKTERSVSIITNHPLHNLFYVVGDTGECLADTYLESVARQATLRYLESFR